MNEKKIVSLSDFKKDRVRSELTNLCRITLDRILYMYNNEMYPETVLLKLIRNSAGLLEKKLKIDKLIKCPDLADNIINELNSYENEISTLTKEINKTLNKLSECKSTRE